MIPALTERYTVVAVDVRGHGQSSNGDSYDPISTATDVRETLASTGLADIDSALIIGHSLGGIIASAYGALFPCRGIVNVDQPLRLSGFKDGLSQLEPLLKGDKASFDTAIDLLFGSMNGALPDEEVARISALRRADPAVVLGVWATVFESTHDELDAQVDAIVGNVTVPYLSLHGIDPGQDYAAWITSSIPTAKFELWPDLGHYPHLVQQERFLELLASFDA